MRHKINKNDTVSCSAVYVHCSVSHKIDVYYRGIFIFGENRKNNSETELVVCDQVFTIKKIVAQCTGAVCYFALFTCLKALP